MMCEPLTVQMINFDYMHVCCGPSMNFLYIVTCRDGVQKDIKLALLVKKTRHRLG